jgi:two-component system, response regulator PdtaR
MRVWLIDEYPGAVSALEDALRGARANSALELDLVGASRVRAGLGDSLRKLIPDQLDAIVLHERACPEMSAAEDVLSLPVALVVVAGVSNTERFRPVVDARLLAFVPPAADAEAVWLALVGVLSAQRREAGLNRDLAQIQQRLADRILIERAKGILIRRLRISEEEAYKRLRVLSRRQRRQVREIAQSLLDTDILFTADGENEASGNPQKETRDG